MGAVMVEELKLKERLEGLLRVLPHNPDLASQIIEFMIDEIDLKVEQFEEENAPS
jgi:hypothetical protein